MCQRGKEMMKSAVLRFVANGMLYRRPGGPAPSRDLVTYVIRLSQKNTSVIDLPLGDHYADLEVPFTAGPLKVIGVSTGFCKRLRDEAACGAD